MHGDGDLVTRLMRWCAMLLLAALVGACGDPGVEPRQPDVEGKPAATSPATPTSATATTSPVESSVTREDTNLIDAFVAFAIDTNATTLGQLPLSPDGVGLGLGPALLRELPPSRAHDPTSWRIDTDTWFRAHVGPFSVLDTVRRHVEKDDQGSELRTPGAIRMSLGEHPHCVNPSVPPPQGLEGMRRVSLQPTDGAITSCLDWFSADLFLDSDRNIVAVTLDIWEP